MFELKKPLSALVGLVLLLTILDIIVVETFYRPTGAWSQIWKYHLIYWTLIVTLPLIAAYKTQSLIPLLTYILFFFGVEDTLFYGLQGYLPKTYWGVSVAGFWQPNLNLVLALNAVGLMLTATIVYLTKRGE